MSKPSPAAVGNISPLLEAEWVIIADRLRLSPRELQIVRRVLADEKEQAIASVLGISVHTVHTHLKHVYRKLGVGSRVQLFAAVFREYVAFTKLALSDKLSGSR